MTSSAGIRKRESYYALLSIFWISFLILFWEVMLIRWLSAEVRIFSYFHNMVLLFCFLGIGLGCASSRKRMRPMIIYVLITLIVSWVQLDQALGIFSLKELSTHLSKITEFFVWAKAREKVSDSYILTTTLAILLLLLSTVSLTMIFFPMGQILGASLNRYSHPISAYSVNIFGSMMGCIGFYGISYLSLPPIIWFTIGGIGFMPFLGRRWIYQISAVVLILTSLLLLYEKNDHDRFSVWSPYQKLSVEPAYLTTENKNIYFGYTLNVNSVGYMLMTNYTPQFQEQYPELFPPDQMPYDHYNIAFRFTEHFDKVLIVGAGAGNDVAGAVRNGAKSVTAVEIDPEIIKAGRKLHPENPYRNSLVEVVNDDARSYFKKSRERFDVVVFGLLDAHTLSSSYSNVRLDNYVYTVESFKEVRQLLKPTGIVVVIFEVGDDFIGARFMANLQAAFGHEPIGFEVRSGFRGWGGYGFVIGNKDVIEERISADPELRQLINRSSKKYSAWKTKDVSLSYDDWPYLYLAKRRIPTLHLIIFCIMSPILFFGIRRTSGRFGRNNWHFFFLGAAFLLLEVQNISKLILLFGATWTVNSYCITSILLMILLANLVVSKFKLQKTRIWYIGLFIVLTLNVFLPVTIYSGLPLFVKGLAAGSTMTLPFFFAGIIFTVSFAKMSDRSGAFASNLFGAMIGGMMECLSYVIGIKLLLLVSAILYLFAMQTAQTISRE